MRRETKQKRADAGILRGKHEAAARRQVENFRIAGNLEHHGAQMGAGQCIEAGAQRIGRVGGAHQKQPCRMNAEFQKPFRGNLAMLERGEILPDPEQMFSAPAKFCQRHGKPRCRTAMCVAREDFVQRTEPQSTFETFIRSLMAERNGAALARLKPRFRERLFEGGQFWG
jgi:hypothetical protein